VEKMKQIYVLPKLGDYIFATSFELWMSNGAHDMFVLAINFLGSNSEPIYKWLLGSLKQNKLLVKPRLPIWQNCLFNMDWEKYIAYVRYKGLNLTTMITSLKLIIKCEVLGLD